MRTPETVKKIIGCFSTVSFLTNQPLWSENERIIFSNYNQNNHLKWRILQFQCLFLPECGA